MDVINDTNAKKDYTFHLAAFNGPLELLMHLIEKNKIDIYDIPIAELTRQYLDYLEAMREMDMEVTSAFLVMAATLLQIKSRMMLPKKKAEENEEEDPRQELVERLLEYRRFKEVSEVLGSMADLQEHFVGRAPLDLPVRHLPPEPRPQPAPDGLPRGHERQGRGGGAAGRHYKARALPYRGQDGRDRGAAAGARRTHALRGCL